MSMAEMPDNAAFLRDNGVTITNVVQSSQPTNTGTFVNGYKITYTAPPNNNDFNIFIPIAAFNANAVAAAIAEQVRQVSAIHSLGA